MRIEIERNDKKVNYKLSLLEPSIEKDIVKFLKLNDVEYKKTEYFEKFFIYNIFNVDSKFICLLANKFEAFIREIVPMSVYSLPIRIDAEKGTIQAHKKEDKKYITLGIIDNGVAKNSQLKDFIIGVDNPYLEENTSYNHGTFVAGIALYGDILENRTIVKNEKFNIFDATVLDSTSIEEDELLKNIFNAVVKHHEKVKVWNLSLSIKLEIYDEYISDFAIIMDYLQKKYNVLICKSGGNGGNFMKKRPKRRLYQGSDSLLALVTASIDNDGKSSEYSRIGLGVKNTIKPDVASYGGRLFLEEDGSMGMEGVKSLDKNGNIVSSAGTSFANARISGLAASIYQNICKDFENFEDFDPTLIKALIIHSAENNDKKLSQAEIGYGIPKDTQEILFYLKNDKIKIYRGTMQEEFKINLMKDFASSKNKFKITLCYDTELDFYQKEEYILSDIKVKNFSEDGKHLTRKFEAEISEDLVLFSENNIAKRFTLIVEKI